MLNEYKGIKVFDVSKREFSINVDTFEVVNNPDDKSLPIRALSWVVEISDYDEALKYIINFSLEKFPDIKAFYVYKFESEYTFDLQKPNAPKGNKINLGYLRQNYILHSKLKINTNKACTSK